MLSLPFGPLWEEIAWRAYALRKLELRFSPLVAAAIVGAYWGIWHIPLWMATMVIPPALLPRVIITACLNLVAWSVIFAFVYERTGQSLPVTILLHTTYGSVMLEFARIASGNDLYLIEAVAVLSACLAFGLAVGNSWFRRSPGAADAA